MRLTAPPHRRAGHALVDAIVGLALGLLAVVLVARAARLAVRTQARTADAARAGHDPADALDLLAARLRDLDPARGDLLETGTALALRLPVGTALLCHAAGDSILLAPGHDDAPWAGAPSRDLAPGDELRTLVLPAAARVAQRVVHVRPVDLPCADSLRPWRERARWLATLAAPVVPAAPGTPVRVLARERWAAYRGGDGRWALGLATWDHAADAWAAPQPVVAPIAPGTPFVASARDAAGLPLVAPALDRARTLTLALGGHARRDSVVVHVPAR